MNTFKKWQYEKREINTMNINQEINNRFDESVKRMLYLVREYLKEKPVQRAFLFGSYSRNQADEKSDVDILVELDNVPLGLKFFTMEDELSHILSKKVELVTQEEIHPYLKAKIDKDKVLIYERI
jgi:predicted nucleotidyltransferase